MPNAAVFVHIEDQESRRGPHGKTAACLLPAGRNSARIGNAITGDLK
jgi:hypothetical protein